MSNLGCQGGHASLGAASDRAAEEVQHQLSKPDSFQKSPIESVTQKIRASPSAPSQDHHCAHKLPETQCKMEDEYPPIIAFTLLNESTSDKGPNLGLGTEGTSKTCDMNCHGEIKAESYDQFNTKDVAPRSNDNEEEQANFGLDQEDDNGGAFQVEGIAHHSKRQESKPFSNLESKGSDKDFTETSDSDSESDSDGSKSDSGSDYEDGDSICSDGISDVDKSRRHNCLAKQKSPTRVFRAKNARQYMEHHHKKKDEARATQQHNRKRKLPCKGVKKSKRVKVGLEMGTSAFLDDGDDEQHHASVAAPPPPAFTASTHEEQFAKLKEGIPDGSDTRRTGTQQKDLEEAASLFGYKKVQAYNGTWKLKGMNAFLEGYQLTAAAWMVKRELSRAEPFGGLLADVMGMGKTVMSLACITGNPPESRDIKEFSRATLVVVPNQSIALQWKEEAQKHCKPPIGAWVSIYSRRKDSPLGVQRKNRIVITTYHELMSQYPSGKTLEKLWNGDEVSYGEAIKKRWGILFKTKWYRVILDEAHAMKNDNSRTAMVCSRLTSKYHWALSGTPLANSVLEFFPYLKFLGCHFTETLRDFKNKYMTEGKSNQAFEALVSMVAYRRTLKDTFLGARILPLPEDRSQELRIPLSTEETLLVNFVTSHYMRQIQKIRDEKKAKDAIKKQGAAESSPPQSEIRLHYAMIMRLPQSVSHPFNLENMLRSAITTKDLRLLKDEFDKLSAQQSILDQILARQDGLEKYQSGLQFLRERKEMEPIFGGLFQWRAMLEMVENELGVQTMTCSGCKKAKPPVRPVRIPVCGHAYCEQCLLVIIRRLPTVANGSSLAFETCKETNCQENIRGYEPINTLEHIIDGQKKAPEKGRDANGVHLFQFEGTNGCFIASAAVDNFPLVPSSKATATMAVLGTWLKESPEDKVIVFVQFITTGKVLGRMLEMAGFKNNFLYYFGRMSQPQKDKALKDFAEDPQKKVLVASMKCGGQSLNLTVANRVILVDPWWNTMVERQAFGRVLRRGQEKETHLVRILVNATIDTKMSSLQVVKSEDIDHALQDDGHVPIALSDAELQKMFEPSNSEAKKRDLKVKRGRKPKYWK